MKKSIAFVWILVLCFILSAAVQAQQPIRVGTLKFGTVNWELDTVTRLGFDHKQGIAVKTVSFANKQAGHILFQNKEVDVIVTDWVWVSRQRFKGRRFSFIPYSVALGAVMVPSGTGIKDLHDLKGMRFGIAGGAYDKSWLLLQAWMRQQHQVDFSKLVDPQYAAPPLLNGQIARNNLDAVLNYWHYCARLEAQGYERFVEMDSIAQSFISGAKVPMIGYVFREEWARKNPGIVKKFNTALRAARQVLLTQDAAWEPLKTLMNVKDMKTFITLRDRFRAGIPRRWGTEERVNAAKLMEVFVEFGGDKLTGGNNRLMAGTFWEGVQY